jgi:Fic family protein
LLWVHPFLDGNGRTARLHTHLALAALQVTHQGIWSPLRGMARDRDGYYARLNNADLPRRNALDGRGPLSLEELARFAAWLLDICLDQSRFMRELLDLEQFKQRLADLLRWLAAHPWAIGSEMSAAKLEAVEALHYVSIAGPLERSRFIAMTGLPSRTARRVLATLLDFGLLVAETPRSPVRFGVPLASLRFLFPRLWPEAESPAS